MELFISNILKNIYEIETAEVKNVPGGWSASAYYIRAKRGEFFLKIFDKNRYTAQSWIKRIDFYIPVVMWLSENTPLRDELVAPVFTKEGLYKFENENHIFILYPYIDGTVPADKKLTIAQQISLAQTVARLHLHGQGMPPEMILETEDFSVEFCGDISDIIKNGEFENIPSQYKANLLYSFEKLRGLSEELGCSNLNFVLCHTDIHGWNLIQSERLFLLDWEGIKKAPAEADLFSFTDGFFFDYAYDIILREYCKIHPDYALNPKVMEFYRLRRRLEDITEFAKSILYDKLSEEEKRKPFAHLMRECSFL